MTAGRPSILMLGTGGFGSRILFDITACTDVPLTVHLAGRDPARLLHLRDAARGRADVFGRDVRIELCRADMAVPGDPLRLIGEQRPDVVVQAASAQPVSALREGDSAWTELIQKGGYSASLVFQAIFTARMARAIRDSGTGTHLVNCCYPDVVNEALASIGLPVTSGVGNIAILAHMLRGSLPQEDRAGFRMLAHYRNLRDWRVAPEERGPTPCRIWLDGAEVADVHARFPFRLSSAPIPDVSGASAAPYLVALAAGRDWWGHLSAPLGLPGGYPVRLSAGELALDLPPGLDRAEAVAFNRRMETADGAVVDAAGNVTYTGRLYQAIRRHSPDIAAGFNMKDIEDVFATMTAFRERLAVIPVG